MDVPLVLVGNYGGKKIEWADFLTQNVGIRVTEWQGSIFITDTKGYFCKNNLMARDLIHNS